MNLLIIIFICLIGAMYIAFGAYSLYERSRTQQSRTDDFCIDDESEKNELADSADSDKMILDCGYICARGSTYISSKRCSDITKCNDTITKVFVTSDVFPKEKSARVATLLQEELARDRNRITKILD